MSKNYAFINKQASASGGRPGLFRWTPLGNVLQDLLKTLSPKFL